MSFKVLSILALVVLVCVLKTTANPVAEKHVAEMAHHPKWEHGSKNHSEAERHNSTQTPHHHDHHDRMMKEIEDFRQYQKTVTAYFDEKETGKTRTKRDAEDELNLLEELALKMFMDNYVKWQKNFESLMKEAEALRLSAGEEPSTLEAVDAVATLAAVDPAPLPAEKPEAPLS